jgi:hypothetical protein
MRNGSLLYFVGYVATRLSGNEVVDAAAKGATLLWNLITHRAWGSDVRAVLVTRMDADSGQQNASREIDSVGVAPLPQL